MAGSVKHTQRTALVQLSQYNGDEHILSGGMTGGVLTYDAGAGTGWSWRDALGLNRATPSTAGTIDMQMGANGVDGLNLRRFTDTGPTGNYLACRSAAGAAITYIQADGAIVTNWITAPVTGLTGTLAISQGGTGDTGTPWTSYTPTITAQGGTFTSTTGAGKYKTIGKTVFFQVSIAIVTVGSATGAPIASLPFTAADNFVVPALEFQATLAVGAGLIQNGSASVAVYGIPIAAGRTILLTGVYQAS